MEIQLLHVLEFTPDRKRMSVIVRFAGNIILYTKGADSVLYDRLRPDSQTTQRQTETQNYLDQYASLGLRTLCFTKKIISSTVYDSWFEDRRRSEMNPFNKEQLILESNDCIETDLLLLGATGIEDRLQDGVADTILALKEAGIKVWVLTGDKKETAVNVGYASNLLQPNFEIISLHARSEVSFYKYCW
jgi:magnesium-transporting ATPase (P-type)